jgi:hypothetical protein
LFGLLQATAAKDITADAEAEVRFRVQVTDNQKQKRRSEFGVRKMWSLEEQRPHALLATVLITLLLAVPAMSVALFRHRGAAKDAGTLEYVFDGYEVPRAEYRRMSPTTTIPPGELG